MNVRLLGLGLLLRRVAAHLLAQLHDALAQLLGLALPRSPPQLEQRALAGHDARDVGLVGLLRAAPAETRSPRAPSRSASSRALRAVSSSRFLVTIARLARVSGLVEAHQHVAGLDAVAVADLQLADDAAGRVLHLLDVAIDDDLSRRRSRRRRCPWSPPSRRRRRPARAINASAEAQMPPHGSGSSRIVGAHAHAVIASTARRPVVGDAPGGGAGCGRRLPAAGSWPAPPPSGRRSAGGRCAWPAPGRGRRGRSAGARRRRRCRRVRAL